MLSEGEKKRRREERETQIKEKRDELLSEGEKKRKKEFFREKRKIAARR